MKVAFSTLGCRVNQYETEAMTEKFIKDGYTVVPFGEFADVYVINTCTVTNMGDKKSRQMIGRARRLNKDGIIAVVGCYSQTSPEDVAKIEGVNVVLGTRNKSDIVYWVNMAKDKGKQIVSVSDLVKQNKFEELSIDEYQDKTRAFLKIQDGCNRFCSYCLIPYARGRSCSKDPDKVIEEVKNLAKHGYKEIIFSGIQIASYGSDLDGKLSLVDILERTNDISGIERIRIGSIDPEFFTDDVIHRIKNLKKVCPHFHLSLQSGCDETLKRMNRRYTSSEYMDIVSNLRKSIKDMAITTDIIVGFPGETDEEFNSTYEFLSKIKLSKMHIFKYSKREGTKAASMEDQVDENTKEERSRKLIDLNEKLEHEFMGKFIGREMDVLYDREISKKQNIFEGYTSNYMKVISKSNENIKGKIFNTKLESIDKDHISGKINL